MFQTDVLKSKSPLVISIKCRADFYLFFFSNDFDTYENTLNIKCKLQQQKKKT